MTDQTEVKTLTLEDIVARLPELKKYFPNTNIHFLGIASSEERRTEINSLIDLGGVNHGTYQYDEDHLAVVNTTVYPFRNHPVVNFRGRTRTALLIDAAIYDQYMSELSNDVPNHQLSIDISLKSCAHFLGVDPKQLYFKV